MLRTFKRLMRQTVQYFGYDVIKFPRGIGSDFVADMRLFHAPCDDIVIFDVGANRGQSVKRFRRAFPRCSVYAFEPCTEAFGRLEQIYGQDEGIVLNKLAVGAHNEKRTLFLNKCSDMTSFLAAGSEWWGGVDGSEVVEIITIDSFCGERDIDRIDLLKSDTQGFELEVLTGARNMLSRGAITFAFVEVNFCQMYEGQATFWKIVEFMNDNQMRFMGLYDCAYRGSLLSWSDALFVHREKADVIRMQGT